MRWRPWQTTSVVLYSTEDYVTAPSGPRKVRRRSSNLWWDLEKAPARKQWKKTSTTSRWHHMYLLMVRSPRLSSVFVASAPCSKSSTLFSTTEFVPLKGNLAFHEKTSNGDWRAFVTDPTRICRHGSPLPHTSASTHLWSLPLTTSICNFTLAARLPFSILIHVLGAAPIKAPLDCFSIPIRSTFRHWNFIFEGCLH